MKNFKKLYNEIYQKLKRLLEEKWKFFLFSCMLVIFIKIPSRPFFDSFRNEYGYYILCGVCALVLVSLKSNSKGKNFAYTKFNITIIFTTGVVFSYLARDYNIFQLIFSSFSS